MRYIITFFLFFFFLNHGFCQWTLIYEFPEFSDIKDIEINESNELFIAVDESIYKSSSEGISWDLKYSGSYEIRSIKFFGTDTGYAAKAYGDGTGICLRTVNNGEFWEIPLVFTSYWPDNNDLVLLNGHSIMLAGGQAVGYAQISDDSFETCDVKYPDPTTKSFSAIDCIGGDTCIIIAGDPYGFDDEVGGIFKTEDHGQNWNEKEIVNLGRDIVFTSKEVVYVLGVFDLLKSIDGGNTWNVVKSYNIDKFGEFCAIKFINDSVGYLGEKFNGLDSIAIYFTSNRGLSWSATEIPDLPISLSAIDCIDEKNCYFTTNAGEIYRTINGGMTSISVIDDYIDEVLILPNPINNIVTIYLNNAGLFNPILTNVFGQNCKFEIISRSPDLIKCDISNLTRGIYFISLDDNLNTTFKFIKL